MPRISRRDLLRSSALAASGFALAPVLNAAAPARRRRVARFAHVTDIHVQPELEAAKGMAAMLHHAQNLKDRPDFIMTGGDLIMDAWGADYGRTDLQWTIFNKVLEAECSLPVEHCIGNHDVWGWSKREGNPVEAAKSGKKWALEVLKLASPFRRFQRAGWHFIVLDSVHPALKGTGYMAQFDEPQVEWLAQELSRIPKSEPVLIVSHIPILSAAVFFDGNLVKDGNWAVPGAWMHVDAERMKDLFSKYPNVKAAISGHLHLVDLVQYNGVSYYCNGAVCGAWWNGNYHECQPGYALMDLFSDGTIERQYVTYGWDKRSK